jgi:sugar phosphate isomerase/epimerase
MKLSVQIYSIRNAGDFDTQLALLRKVGFDWVESVALHGLAPAEFAAKLEQHGLKLSSMHAGLALVEQQRDMLIQACKLTGCPLVVMPFLPYGERPRSAAGWRAMGERLGAVGREFNAAGIRFGYHNHDFEFLVYEGRPALDWLFGSADAAALGWQADMGWVSRAGADPLVWGERLGPRILAVHAKDIAAEGQARNEDGWAALGQGVVAWPALFTLLRKYTDLFVFEHDNPSDFEARLSVSLAFMKQHLA